jgi:hypothetical protein
MLDGVYVDTVEEKAIVAIQPKPAFPALFQVATTKEGSGVVLYNEKASTLSGSSDELTPCFWWRRGRVECSLFATNIGSSFTQRVVRALVQQIPDLRHDAVAGHGYFSTIYNGQFI